ncbi:MAG: hypothetical protein ACJ739_09670 [Acidimicrobiales bacterium]
MSAPVTRRRRHRGPDHTFLPSLAAMVDQATAGAPGHVLVRVEGPCRPDVNLGLRPLDEGVHPFDELAGFDAPDEWTVLGLRTTGQARHLDRPGAAPQRIASTFLVDRRGREASVLRFDHEVIDEPGRAVGTIPDTCRRVMGLPTDPPPRTTELLWSTMWVDRILERWAQPDRRCDLASFAQLAILHPSVHAPSPPDVLTVADPASLARVARAHAAATTWSALRFADEPLPLPDGPLSPQIARWMDDGFFARWVIGAYPRLETTAFELKALLGRPLGPLLVEALVRLLEPADGGRAGREP